VAEAKIKKDGALAFLECSRMVSPPKENHPQGNFFCHV